MTEQTNPRDLFRAAYRPATAGDAAKIEAAIAKTTSINRNFPVLLERFGLEIKSNRWVTLVISSKRLYAGF
jgi:hypothetical protein